MDFNLFFSQLNYLFLLVGKQLFELLSLLFEVVVSASQELVLVLIFYSVLFLSLHTSLPVLDLFQKAILISHSRNRFFLSSLAAELKLNGLLIFLIDSQQLFRQTLIHIYQFILSQSPLSFFDDPIIFLESLCFFPSNDGLFALVEILGFRLPQVD